MNEQISEMLDRLTDLDEAGLATLEGAILSSFSELENEDPTVESVEKMTELADALDNVRGELSRRTEQEAELKAKAEQAASRIKNKGQEDENEDPAAVEEPPAVDEPVDSMEEEVPSEEPVTEEEDEEERKKRGMSSDSEVAKAEVDTEETAAEEEQSPDVAEQEEDELSSSTEPVSEEEKPEEEPATEAASDSELSTPSNEKETPVTASTPPAGEGAMKPPADAAPVARTPEGLGLTITAGADIPGVGVGSELSSMDDIAQAFSKRLHTLRNVTGGSGEQQTIATLSYEYPEDRRLSGDFQSDLRKVRKTEALTAAAGICAPLETLYDINICGVADRPIRDSLTRFQADRGGVRMYKAPQLPANTVGIWDPANPTPKVCADALCPDPEEFGLKAIYACMCFSNYTNKFFPEVIKANTDLALINQARFGEQYLLKGINEASTKVTYDAAATDNGGKGVGITRAIIGMLRRAAAGLRRRHRLAPNTQLRTILPVWVLDAMVADLAYQMPGDGLEVLGIAESKLTRLFSDSNINVTWALDEVDAAGAPLAIPAQAAGALEGFPVEINIPLYFEGAFLFLDGGTLDLGVVRDKSTMAANEYCTFVESFENVIHTGCESIWITMTGVCANGAAAALVDTAC